MWRSHIRILTTTLCVNPTAPTLVSKIKRPRSNQNFISISILLNQYFCNLCQTGRIMNQSRCMQVDSDTTSSYRKLQLIWIEPQSINQIYLSSTKNQFCGKCSGMKNYYSQTKRETKFTLKKRKKSKWPTFQKKHHQVQKHGKRLYSCGDQLRQSEFLYCPIFAALSPSLSPTVQISACDLTIKHTVRVIETANFESKHQKEKLKRNRILQ